MTTTRRFRTLNSKNFCERLEELFERNSYDENAGVDGFMFETFGQEMDHVREVYRQNPQRIVTIIEGESGAWWVANGFHFVNRIGYLIAKPEVTLPDFFEFKYI